MTIILLLSSAYNLTPLPWARTGLAPVSWHVDVMQPVVHDGDERVDERLVLSQPLPLFC
jgi:hypothetical protein